MQYALLIYTNETADSQASQQEQEATMVAYTAFGEQFKEQITGGEALLPTSSATTVRLREGALGHATTVHPLVQSFDERGWIGGALGVIQQKRKMRTALPRGARKYAWILFRPETEALSEMARLVELGRLSFPIGIRAPLRDTPKAFDHVRRHIDGRRIQHFAKITERELGQ